MATTQSTQAGKADASDDVLPALRLHNVSRTFGAGQIVAVDNLNLEVLPGEILSILGPSGCGKTTTMRMIAGLDEPTAGDIEVFGKSVTGQPPHIRNVGLVFQTLAIFPHMSVEKNVAFGLRMKKMASADIARKVKDVLDLVHLPHDEYGLRMPKQLSGGQLQRVALARTLVTEPSLVLFDEPMAALDRRLRDYMAIELRKIQKDLNIAAVYVTHDQETASAMSDRIAVIKDGKLVQIGTPEEVYTNPVNRFVAEFLGDVNVLTSEHFDGGEGGAITANIADGHLAVEDDYRSEAGDGVVIVRPEHVELVDQQSKDASLIGRVIESQFGSGIFKTCIQLSDGQELIANSVNDNSAAIGSNGLVGISVRHGRARMIAP